MQEITKQRETSQSAPQEEAKRKSTLFSDTPRYMSLYKLNVPHYTDDIRNDPALSTCVTHSYSLRPKESYIQVRLIYNGVLPLNLKTGKPIKQYTPSPPSQLCCAGKTQHKMRERKPLENLVIHIHGGGFIAQDSYTHSPYLRKWAVQTGLPVISIDYRLAPEHEYPSALDDCWQVYYWVVRHSE